MTGARRRALLVAVIAGLVVAVAAFALARSREAPKREKPVLLLLTSLPIVFGEDFSLDSNGSPTLDRLERSYRVVPIATSSAQELGRGRLLFMAQPLAQPAEDLVALDAWVRRGGRVVLLADPLLERPDSRALSDPTRPPPGFMDTGLLSHWGLRLDAPDERGPRDARIGGEAVTVVSPGVLSGRCAIEGDGLRARCRIGKGEAVVIADADFLDRSPSGADAIIAELARLAPR